MMKDEVKEILEALKPQDKEFAKAGIKEYSLVLSVKEQKILLDYITNLQAYYNDNVNKYEELIVKYSDLQEENERLKKPDYYEKGLIGSIKERDEIIQDYKSRCEKAIEYLNYNDETLYTFELDYDCEENIVDNYEPSSYREDLLNILQGSDKE